MKKSKKILIIILCAVVAVGAVTGGTLYHFLGYHPSKYLVESDKNIPEADFETVINDMDFMSNKWEDALPQTYMYHLIKNHLNDSSGGLEKKVIVIGYDGCRADLLPLIKTSQRSAVSRLISSGGQAVFSFCGGVNYPEKNIQDSSTAPGWCSMLTGCWSDVHGITTNGVPKELQPRTLLIELVEDGICDSSAFYVSWDGHFSRKDSTYINEKNYAKEKGLNVTFKDSADDNGTKKSILKDLKQEDCSDFIFSTLEYTDHAGHNFGFSPSNVRYVSGFRDAENTALEIIQAINERPNYSNEDWLILITTDHGGFEKGHGGPTMEERVTFIVSNKQILK